MSRNRLFIVLLGVVVGVTFLIRGCLRLETSSPIQTKISDAKQNDHNKLSSVAEAESKSKNAKVFETFISVIYTPIVFYGKVVDQNGNPILGADVLVSVSDKVGGGGSKLNLRSGGDGKFTVNTHGMSIYVKVSKGGYYDFPEYDAAAGKIGQVSGDSFDYGQSFGKGVHQPAKDDPVIFTLYRPSPSIGLIRIPLKTLRLSRDGTILTYLLKSKTINTGKSIVLRCWTQDDKKLPDGRYDWRMEISILNGQLQPRSNDFDFIAPENGYTNMQVIEMPASLPRVDWHSDVDRLFWIKYDDGTYGRLKVGMVAGGDHFALVDGYLNAEVGSRNLEADPKLR